MEEALIPESLLVPIRQGGQRDAGVGESSSVEVLDESPAEGERPAVEESPAVGESPAVEESPAVDESPAVVPSPADGPVSPIRMKSVDRVSKLPVVEETLKIAFNIYGKVKGANCIFNWSLKTVEHTAAKAAKTTQPLMLRLQRPIKIVDNLMCVGLNCLETNIPAVKLHPSQMYENTKQCARNCAKKYVNCAIAVKDCGMRKIQKLRRLCAGSDSVKTEAVEPED